MTSDTGLPDNSTNSPTNAIPLIVGVTGHRDLVVEDVPRIRELVREVFLSLKAKYPHTPLVLLSPLVEGADQLVAEVARQSDIGARLIAVLCSPSDESPASETGLEKLARGGGVGRFQEWLTLAGNIVAMPLDDEARRLAAVDESAFAERQYELVGKYVARHSQLLIALWDGDASASSGTARVVEWQRNGAPAPFAAQLGELDIVEGAPICHIQVRRTSSVGAAAANDAPTATYLYPQSSEGSAEEEIHRTWSNIDGFNRDIAELRHHSPQWIAQSRSYVLPDAKVARLTPGLRELLEFYAAADAAAIAFQSRVRGIARGLFVIGPLALVCLEVYAHLWSHWPALAAYLVLLAVGYWMFRKVRGSEWEGKYLDDRALAEALRVQFFWRLGGLTDCAAEHYLRHLRGELGWIRQAARTCFLLTGDTRSPSPAPAAANTIEPGSEESLRDVLTHWLRDQANFFTKKAPLNERSEARCESIIKWSFRAAMAIAVAELVVHWQTGHANHLLIVLAFFGLVAVAMAEEFADYHMFGIQARQYEWMKNLYATAAQKLAALIAAKNVAKSQALIHDLGLEALNENADWLVQRRRKPVVLPK